MQKNLVDKNKKRTFAVAFGALAHLVERNTGSVEVSGSSPLCSTKKEAEWFLSASFFCLYAITSVRTKN